MTDDSRPQTPDAAGPDPDFPDRPDHPDFRWLSAQVTANDAASESLNFTLPAVLSALPIDPASLTYLAENRAVMAINYLTATGMLRGVPMSVRLAFRSMVAGMYLDSFYLGAQYGRHLAEEGR